MKERLDVLIACAGLAESREKAQLLIRAGAVLVNGVPVSKPGRLVDVRSNIQIKSAPPFVSRGGLKLDHAIRTFHIPVAGLSCIDVGASTGGFTDCLLKHGARRVIALDVGRGQLHWSLRNDPRVIVLEGVNARYLEPNSLPYVPELAAIDVSFISLAKILPAVRGVLAPGGSIVTLIKPQFEAARKDVKKGGRVTDPAVRAAAVERITKFATQSLGLKCAGADVSPVRGPAGNVEFLAYFRLAWP